MVKGKEIKEMRRRASFRPEVLGQKSLRADCLENVPSVPGFPVPGFPENVPSVPGFLSPDSRLSPDSVPGFTFRTEDLWSSIADIRTVKDGASPELAFEETGAAYSSLLYTR
jgi:hypothetical protein